MPKHRLAVSAVILDSKHRVLLVRQGKKRHDWELPGGKVKKRESIPRAILREVKEETGIEVKPQRMAGIFFIPEESFFDFIIACKLAKRDQKPRPNRPEISHCKFFPVNQLPKPIRPFTVQRIHDAMNDICHPLPVELTSKQWLG